jgi:hypothetical protein
MPTLNSKSIRVISARHYEEGSVIHLAIDPISGESKRQYHLRLRKSGETVNRKLRATPQSFRTSFDMGFLHAAAIAPWDGVVPKN